MRGICRISILTLLPIFRHDEPIRPPESTIVEAGDEVFFIAASQHIRAVMSEYGVWKTLQAHHAGGRRQYRRRAGKRLEKDYNLN